MKKKAEPNEPLYHELLRPFESREALDAAIHAFFTEVEALRIKHRIPDVCVIAQAEAMVDGFPSELHLVGHIGNQANKIPMLAQGLGRARGEFDAAMGQLRRPYF